MHFVFLLISLGGLGWPAHAYLQYALINNQVSCTACHYSPVGGGPKTSDGKLYGSHAFAPNVDLMPNYFSGDLRILYYRAKEARAQKGGMGVMSGSIALHAPLDEDRKIFFVLEHNLAGFSAAPLRDTYVLFRLPDRKWINSVLVGRFRAPFGVVTDEHRTYTRIQTSTEFYTMETGVLLSGKPLWDLHYNLAFVNGTQSGGSSLNTGQADQWGVIGDLRWLRSPLLAGASASHFDPREDRLARNAYTIYTGATWKSLLFLAEYTRARGFNSTLGRGFASSAAYADAAARAHSEGVLGWFEWMLNHRFSLIYKYDRLTPDTQYPADIYDRHGLGFRWAVGPLTSVQARFEKALATHPSESSGAGWARQDALFGLLQVSL